MDEMIVMLHDKAYFETKERNPEKDDTRLDEALDIVEDNLFLADEDKPGDAWFSRTSNRYFYLPAQCYVAMAHLRRDDAPNFLRATFTQYACEINPEAGYVFREGPGGGNDKIQETSAFVLRIRAMLVMEDEDSDSLWLARGTPRAWLEQGKRISVKNAPSSYGAVGYEIVSDVEKDRINATVELPSRKTPQAVLLKLRHPKAAPIKSVMVNGKPWSKFNPGKEMIELKGLTGQVAVPDKTFSQVRARLESVPGSPIVIALDPDRSAFCAPASAGTICRYELGSNTLHYPDPASRYQPDKPHGSSQSSIRPHSSGPNRSGSEAVKWVVALHDG